MIETSRPWRRLQWFPRGALTAVVVVVVAGGLWLGLTSGTADQGASTIAQPSVSGPGSSGGPASAAASATVASSGASRKREFQRIDGFGSSERTFGDPHVFEPDGVPPMSVAQQDAVLTALYVDLGLTRVRPAQPDTTAGPPPGGIEIADDNADPSAVDRAKFNFEGKRLDDHASLLARAKSRGATVAWNSPLNREAWMGVSPGTDDAAEYAEWLLTQVKRFDERGGRLKYISIANEPSFARNTMSGEFMRDVIKKLGPRLEAERLLVPFVIPDDVRSSDGAAKAATILADRSARRYVGALATHLYDEPLENLAAMRALARRYDLPLWMSEFTLDAMGSMRPRGSSAATPLDWALLMHELLATYDVSAVDYLWGYFGGAKANQTTLITLKGDQSGYDGFSRNKVYYYFGQYSRFVRPGARRVLVTSRGDPVKATAYRRDRTRTIVAINPGDGEATTTMTVPALAGVRRLTQTRTSATEHWAKPRAVSVKGTRVTVTLAPQSVTTLSGPAR